MNTLMFIMYTLFIYVPETGWTAAVESNNPEKLYTYAVSHGVPTTHFIIKVQGKKC